MLTIVFDAAPLITACKFEAQNKLVMDHVLAGCRIAIGPSEGATMKCRMIGFIVTLALGIGFATLSAVAQPPSHVRQIGMLVPVSPAEAASYIEAFRQGLRELGYVEGRTIAIEYHWAEGKRDRLVELATGLARLKVDVILTWTPTLDAKLHPLGILKTTTRTAYRHPLQHVDGRVWLIGSPRLPGTGRSGGW